MNIGIIGNGSDKFTFLGRRSARDHIREILFPIRFETVVVSGHSPMGGVDIWAEEIADQMKIPKKIFPGLAGQWEDKEIVTQHKLGGEKYGDTWWTANKLPGYKTRNLDIAITSDALYIIVANKYPKAYKGKREPLCYHDKRTDHCKSGACYTGKKFAEIHNKDPIYIIIDNGE
jgi:hypothetical protein